jgi:hypothetical protein
VTVFNLGAPGADSFGNLVHLRRLLADGIHPDLVLLEPTLATLLHRGDQAQYWAKVFPPACLRRNEINLLQRYSADLSNDDRLEWSLARLLPMYAHRFSLLSKAAPLLLPHSQREDYLDAVDPWGGYRFPERVLTPEGRKTALAAAKTEYEVLLKQTQVSEANMQALREGVAVCQRNHIAVGLLLMPEGPTFRGWYQPGCADRLVNLLEYVSRSDRVSLINARCWFDSEEPFIDSHHLAPDGASSFSYRLATEGLLPMLSPAGATARASANGG